jgi:putative ABC transport system permease protein
MKNLRFALRALFHAPFVTIIAILSLALGIGANTAIFSLFNQLLLQPLPVPQPTQLVNLGAPGPKDGSTSCNQAGDCDVVFSYPMFRDLEREQKVFTGIAAHRIFGVNIGYEGQTLTGEGMLVSGSYFPVLGLTPARGRLIDTTDDRTVGQSPVVVLGYDYWRTRFAESPAILGSSLVVNGQPMTVVGVAPRGFRGTTKGTRPQVFVPMTMRGVVEAPFAAFDNRRSYWVYLFARLKPGVSIDAARSGINQPYQAIINGVEAPLQKGVSEPTLARFKAKQVTVDPGARGQSDIFEEAGAPLTLLLSVTIVVLLIACANIANLLLARSAARAGEMAVRLSIGASRGRLVRQLLLEACLLALFGGVAGLLVARWTMALILSLLPADASDVIQFEFDLTIMLFAGALSVATGLLFGLFPALHSTRPDLAVTLKNQAGQPSGARSAARFRRWLVTGQIMLSMGLLGAAGLFTKSLMNVSKVDLGIDAESVVTFTVGPRRNGYTPERSQVFFERLEDELAALPGVVAAAAARVPLLAGSNSNNGVSVQGFEAGPDTNTSSSYNEISPGYFRTIGVPLLAGRDFTRADSLKAPKVAIVNEAFARKFNMGRDVVGKRMSRSKGNGPLDIEIIGLVKDAKYSEVKVAIPPVFFVPYRQNDTIGGLAFYVRTMGNAEELARSIPPVVARLDPNLPVTELRTIPQQIQENVFLDRFISVMSASFAALATLLAAIGLYGVLAYTVAQRTREFGLRMALGAAPTRLGSLVMKQVAWMTAIGGAVGVALAIGAGFAARSQLFGMVAYDPIVLGIAAIVLVLVALSAGLVPAIRASRIDPMRALRYE